MLAGLMLLAGVWSWWVAGRLSQAGSRLYLLDHPNQRSLHKAPTPRTGGVAIGSGLLVGLLGVVALRLVSWEWGGERPAEWATLVWLITLASVLAVISFLDDRRGLPIWGRFTVQVGLAVVLVVGGKVAITSFAIPLVGTWDLGPLSLVGSIMFLVWMTNLYNFMDGMDGFAGGMTVMGGLYLAFLGWMSHHQVFVVVPLLLAGASAGFLVHNFPPARIFMGDVGSVPIGFLIGALTLWGCRDGVFDLWVPLMVFSPFVADATVTLVRRSLRGEKVWEAHRSHFYQRLVLLGWGHRRTVLVEYVLMVLCAALAWWYQLGDDFSRLLSLVLWSLLLTALMAGVSLADTRRNQAVAG